MCRILMLVLILLLIAACDKKPYNSACKSISEAADKRYNQIHAYMKDSNFKWERNMYESGLGLKSIRDSIDGLELRVWYFDGSPQQLYRLRCSNLGEWVGEKYNFRYLKNSQGAYTKGSGNVILKSKDQWEAFLDRVFKNGLLEFPDIKSVQPKEAPYMDATMLICEAACGNKYFYYEFMFPYYDNDSIPFKFNKVIGDFDSTFTK
jgi:hypothetical protein